MSEQPDVSFVVPSWSSRATVEATLRSILNQKTTSSFETLVVDSTEDETADWIADSFPGVKVIHSRERLLPGAARNRGARECQGRLLAFVDADVRLQDDWLETMRTALSRGESTLLVGGWVANANPESISSRLLHWIEFSEALPGFPSGRKPSLSSSNWLISKASFEESGGFSESLAMAEDLLLCSELPGEIHFESASVVFHEHRSSWSGVRLHLQRLGFWSGRLRTRVHSAGSQLRRVPRLSFLLPFYRTPRILWRVTRANVVEGLICLALLPLLMVALCHWSAGFYLGLSGAKEPPG